MPIRNLANLHEGEGAFVSALSNVGTIKRRLQDLGLVEGTYVYCVQYSPFGDPVAYRIRGAIIALRQEDAEGVWID